jgi:hypothetical protein
MKSLMAADSNHHLRTFIIASVAGIASLFPLIFTPQGAIPLHIVVPQLLTTVCLVTHRIRLQGCLFRLLVRRSVYIAHEESI